MCIFDVIFEMDMIIIIDVIKKSTRKIVINMGQKLKIRYFDSLSIYITPEYCKVITEYPYNKRT